MQIKLIVVIGQGLIPVREINTHQGPNRSDCLWNSGLDIYLLGLVMKRKTDRKLHILSPSFLYVGI